MSAGGFGETMPATPEIQEIADQARSEVEGKENTTYPVFEAISYRQQIVAGIIYLIKVSISDSSDECVHLEVSQSISDGNEIRYETGKTKDDELTPF